jgi:hypothetical protein
MRTLDVRQIVQRAKQEQIKIAGLEITYNTAPGSVIVAAHSQSANDNQVFRVPMWDPLGQRSPTGGYPWRIEGASTTKTYIKNITDREQYYVAYLTWENDGAYMIGMKRLLPYQTIEIDIKRLRDEQIPDEAGRIIPLTASSGQLKWSLKQTEEPPAGEEARQQLALIGRTEQIDIENGISSNYACQSCCDDSYYDGYIDPISSEVEVGEQINYRAFQRDIDCNNAVTPYYQRITILDGRTDWNSNNTSVATIGGDSNATATGPGQTTIYASWQDYNNPQGIPCQSYLTDPDEEYISEGKETSENQATNIAPQFDFAEPPCENCTNNMVFPVLSVILTVKTPRVTSVTAAPAQDVKRVTQVLGNQDIIHFVTPKGAANSQVTLTAAITPNNPQVLNDISWEGATESATNPLEAAVSKDTASKKVVKIKYRGTVIKELRVWVVWATITSTQIAITSFSAYTGNPSGYGAGIYGGYNFTHTIQPAEIITDSDRPNFSGAKSNNSGPPGGNNPINGQALSGGADKKWDNSRQIRFKILNPNNISASDTSFTTGFPSDFTYPSDEVVGNDDTSTGANITPPEETNDPYSNNRVLTGRDAPITAICDRAGINGNTFESRLQFREFTRLEIEGTWYRISDFYLWKFHRKLKKVNGVWLNDSSILALDNLNF